MASLVLVGVQSPSKIKPPADCRGEQMYCIMQSMTRTSQQVRLGVLEYGYTGGRPKGAGRGRRNVPTDFWTKCVDNYASVANV